MDSGKINYYEKIEKDSHKDFICVHNNCILCGSALELRHVALSQTTEIKEEAFCPECDMRTRSKTFTLN